MKKTVNENGNFITDSSISGNVSFISPNEGLTTTVSLLSLWILSRNCLLDYQSLLYKQMTWRLVGINRTKHF